MTSPEQSQLSAPGSSCSKTCAACSPRRDDRLVAYVAGIIDGEGSFVIASTTTNGRTRYWPMAVVQMAKPHALNVLRTVLGGRLGPVARHGHRPGWAGMLRWELSGSSLRCPLVALLPFLTVKKAQAGLLLEMLDREWPASTNGRGISWTPETSAEWQKAKDRIQELNRRGTAVTNGAIAQRVGDHWMTLRTDLFGERWETFSGPFPASGSMRGGSLFEHRTSAPHTAANASSSSPGLLPTPRVRDGKGRDPNPRGVDLNEAVALLPTPRATDGTKGGPNQRGSSGDLMLPSAVQHLLPTPTATPYGNNQSPSPGAAVRPSLDSLASSGALLPTPMAADGGLNRGSSAGNGLRNVSRQISRGETTSPPSAAGSTSPGAPHPHQLSLDDTESPA